MINVSFLLVELQHYFHYRFVSLPKLQKIKECIFTNITDWVFLYENLKVIPLPNYVLCPLTILGLTSVIISPKTAGTLHSSLTEKIGNHFYRYSLSGCYFSSLYVIKYQK